MNRCGDCVHSRIVPEDVTKRVCKGAPPQIAVIPNARGATLTHMWPTVLATDEGCGLFKQKLVVDIGADTDVKSTH